MKISASFLASKDIFSTVEKLNNTDVDYIHVDFVDNKFVKGKKIPFHKLKKIDKYSSKRLDIHLMAKDLDKYIKKFALLNAEFITFHVEIGNVEKYINMIHSYGIKCGLAINPNTDISEVIPHLDSIEMVLVMGVNPGYGGQAFIPEVVSKLKQLYLYIKSNSMKVIVSVDGGINDTVIDKVDDYTDMVVVGSYITNSDDYQSKINSLR